MAEIDPNVPQSQPYMPKICLSTPDSPHKLFVYIRIKKSTEI